MSDRLDRAFWEDRYRDGHPTVGDGQPTPHLVAAVPDRAGAALDAGCGEGADAIWLAERGWRVTAVDVAATALGRARERAATRDAGVAARIDWLEADLTAWTPPEERFDLVCAFYVHPAGPHGALVGRLAAAVAPGGTLLVVGHHPSDHGSSAYSSVPGVHVTAEELRADLAPDRWEVVAAGTRSRRGVGHDGSAVPLEDVVLQARRRP